MRMVPGPMTEPTEAMNNTPIQSSQGTPRFGEFLYDNKLISEEELLAVLADHWSNGGRIGVALARTGLLTPSQVERWAAIYHEFIHASA